MLEFEDVNSDEFIVDDFFSTDEGLKEEQVDQGMFVDSMLFNMNSKDEEDEDEELGANEFTPRQIGSITTYIEPISGETTIDDVALMFKNDKNLPALPIEEYDKVVAVIDRDWAERHTDTFMKRWLARPVIEYVHKNIVMIDAREYIERTLGKVSELQKEYNQNYFPVFEHDRFVGLTSIEQFLARISDIREQDMEKACAIQQSLFPAPRFLKRNFKFSINTFNRMANTLGGDCYEAFTLSDHEGLICCFDVSGKNVAASLMTVAAMAYFKMILTEKQISHDPVKILAGLDAYLENVIPIGNFITGAIVYYDTQRQMLYVFNCGHTTIYLVYKNPKNGGAMKLAEIEPKLPPFGMGQVKIELEASEYTNDISKKPYNVIAAKQGVHIALYSDGFTDMKNEVGERFEEENARDFFVDLYSQPPEAVSELIENTIDNFVGSGMIPDDITVIDVRFDSEIFV